MRIAKLLIWLFVLFKGNINSARIKAKLNYKNAIRAADKKSQLSNSKTINEALANKDNSSFWKIWNGKFNNKANTFHSIDGSSNSAEAANILKEYFSNTFTDSLGDDNSVREFINDLSAINNSDNNF